MEKKRQMSAIDVYQSVVYKWGNLMLVTAAMCASLIFLLFDILGMLSFNVVAISSFVAMDVIYYIFCVWMVKTSFDQDNYLKEGRLKLGKIFTSFVVIVQWNCILYMVPSRTFWGFLFFFMILIAFYLDIKMTIIDGMTCISSLVVSWFVNGYNLPIDDEIFITDFLLMVVGISLSMIGMIVFILFMTKFLVNAKKDELEENNNRVLNVLDKVNSFTSQLGEASKSLVSTAQNQSASTEELSGISQGLLESCSKMLQKSEQSQYNLISLQDSSRSVGEKMQVVNAVSKELTLISQTNENSLNELIGMSEEVKKSTSKTKDVTEKLLKESSEIGSTLGIINEIAEDINLLALNASIEAARAGEAGKGFAVVAQEVGDLAENTKKSLESVGEMVNAIQIGTTDVSNFMNENAEQLLEQNKVILETVEGIRNMMELLKKSVNAIEEADKLCISQSEVIKHTVNINKDIAEGINSENKEFSNIASMVESNNKEVMGLSNQVDSINSMINELEKLLDK